MQAPFARETEMCFATYGYVSGESTPVLEEHVKKVTFIQPGKGFQMHFQRSLVRWRKGLETLQGVVNPL